MNQKCAFVTYIMNGDSYLEGALVLATSLLNSNTLYDILVMVTPDVSHAARNRLNLLFHQVIEIPYIRHPCKLLLTESMNYIYGDWIEKSFTKLNILKASNFPGYYKLCYLDADQVVLENIDHLFTLQAPALSFDSEYSDKHRQRGIFNPFKFKNHGDVISWKEISYNCYNCLVGASGTMVITPDDSSFNEMLTILNSYEKYGHEIYNGFEEQLLAELFVKLKINPVHISKMYCWNAGQYHALENNMPKVINFYGLQKPWLLGCKKYMDYFIWLYFKDLMLRFISRHK